MEPIIVTKNLKHCYLDGQNNEFTALDGIDLTINQGEFVSIIGSNGSGKSTLAKHFNALLIPTEGSCEVAGYDTKKEENHWKIRQQVGMVFQNPDNQFVGATVEDDVAFGLENQGIPLEEMQSRVQQALELVKMSDFKDREPARLSGGQKQRVAIAGAVAMRPAIIILDEATSMLDPEGRLELIQTIKDIRQRYGMTVISITHDLEEVALSDRVLVMKNGQVESDTSPQALFSRGEELLNLGLDRPFTSVLIQTLKEKGFAIDESYLTEKDLEEKLWASISKR